MRIQSASNKFLACAFLGLLASGAPLFASAVFYVSSMGGSQNTGIFGATVDVNGNVTSWGSKQNPGYVDIAFRLVASASNTELSSSAVWITANNAQGNAGNLLRATWFAGPIIDNPTYSSRLGTASINSTLLTSAFGDFMIGPSAFTAPVPISTSGSEFFIRIWATGNNANDGFGVKVTDNTTLQYASPDSPITMYNWNGTSYSTNGATTNLALVPEPSAFSLLLVGLGGLAALRRRKSD